MSETKPSELLEAGEAAVLAIETIETRKTENDSGKSNGIQFCVPELRDIIRPLYAGEVCMMMGLSGNGKSFFIKKQLGDETLRMMRERETNRVNVIVTWEESAEVLAMAWMAHMSGISSTSMMRGEVTTEELAHIKGPILVKVGQYPIYIIGASNKRDKNGKRVRPDLSMPTIDKCFEYIMNTVGLEINMLCLDYLQRIPQTDDGPRPMHVLKCVDWVKDSAFWTGAKTYCATQAKQEILKRVNNMPQLYDSEWSANAAQSADMCLCFEMPKKENSLGEYATIQGYGEIMVEERLLFIFVAKQKQDRDGQVLAVEIQPEFGKLRMHALYYNSPWAAEAKHNQPQGGLDAWPYY